MCVMLPCHADSETLGAQKMRKQKRPQTSRENSFKQQVQYNGFNVQILKVLKMQRFQPLSDIFDNVIHVVFCRYHLCFVHGS